MKILHLDDHQLFTEGLALALHSSDSSFKVFSAINKNEAFNLIEQHPDLDLILIDISMPEMDGITFIQTLIERKILIPTAVLTASEDPWQIKQAIALGTSGYLPKHWSLKALKQALISILAGEVIIPDFMLNAIAALPKQQPSDPKLTQAIAKGITPRQVEVLELIQSGFSNKKIADILCISETTVKSHVKALFQAMQSKNRFECVRFAEQLGLLDTTPRQIITQNNY